MDTTKLPENTVALVRLPIPIRRLTELCEMFNGPDYRIHQQDEWIVVTEKKGGES